jgi:hypothetical protein
MATISRLVEAKADAASLEHEREQGQALGSVEPISRRGSTRRRQDALGLVEAEGLPADSGTRGHFADTEAIPRHA